MAIKVGKKSRWLFVPVEVKVRELLAKILLACKAAERGYTVVLGEAHAVREMLYMLPAGVLMEKGVAPPKSEKFNRYRAMGNKIVSWCEEGLVFFDDEDYIRRKFNQDDLKIIECFFAWGKYQAKVVERHFPEMSKRIEISGNPRLDLLRKEYRGIFQEEVDKLYDLYGDFILFNSNFQHCNHKHGDSGYVELLKKQGRFSCPEEEKFIWEFVAHKKRLFDAFIHAIRSIRGIFPKFKIIIRPHPGENYAVWRDFFISDTGIEVIHDGGVIPWILASSVLVHNGCTTGIEAALLNQPAIAFRPVLSKIYDQHLPNSVNAQADTEAELIESLSLILNQRMIDSFISDRHSQKILEEFITSKDDISACDTILNRIDLLHHDIMAKNRRPWFPLHKYGLKKYIGLSRFINRILGGDINRGDYSKQKFNELSLCELEDEIAKFKKVTDRFNSINSIELASNVFLIHN